MQAVVRRVEEGVYYEIYKQMIVTVIPGRGHEMDTGNVGFYRKIQYNHKYTSWQNVCIYAKKYTYPTPPTIYNPNGGKWIDLDMPVRPVNHKYFQQFGIYKNNDSNAVVKYLQEIMRKQDLKAPTIITDNRKYITRSFYGFTLPEEYAALPKLKL